VSTTTTTEPLLVSTREACAMLGCGQRTLHQLREAGVLEARRRKNAKGAAWRWVRSTLVRYAEDGA
jgi:hypothetical protein